MSGRILAKVDAGKVNVAVQKLSIPAAEMRGRFQLDQNQLSGKFDIETQSLKKLIPHISAYFENSNAEPIKKFDIDGRVHISGKLGGLVRSPTIEAELNGENILEINGTYPMGISRRNM